LYGFLDCDGDVKAILLFGGDKSRRGNEWYGSAVAEAERRLEIISGQRGWRVVGRRS
jgi:hypothetical protein